MKENISNFNLEAAFKALDEIEIPQTSGIKANVVNLNETFKICREKKNKTDLLIEDYYDLNSKDDLEAAKNEREEEIAQAKLARIEKIVDLDADTVDDLLPTYVGKRIIQCPQCMTLFYKAEEDLEPSEEDELVVNVGEVCQHCGNDTGYNLIGKVDAVDPEEEASEEDSTEKTEDEVTTEEEVSEESEVVEDETPVEESEADESAAPAEETAEFADEEPAADESADLEPATEEEPEETTNESFDSDAVDEEDVDEYDEEDEDADLYNYDFFIEDAYYYLNKLGYFDVLGKQQADDIIAAYDKYMADRKNGKLVGNTIEIVNQPDGMIRLQVKEKETDSETNECLKEELVGEDNDVLTEATFSDADIDNMLKSKEFTTPVTDSEINSYFSEEYELADAEEFVEESFNQCVTDYLQEVYQNVNTFELTACEVTPEGMLCEGLITFNSGKTKNTTFIFNKTAERGIFEGYNNEIATGKAFTLDVSVNKGKQAITESLKYHYSIANNIVEGLTVRK